MAHAATRRFTGVASAYQEGQPFHPERLGKWRLPPAGADIPPAVWQEALTAQKETTPPPEAGLGYGRPVT